MASNYDDSFLVRVNKADKARWTAQAKEAGISLADAVRIGTAQYLDGLAPDQTPDDPLLAEFRALGARLEQRFRT
jgi:hypothetical protein